MIHVLTIVLTVFFAILIASVIINKLVRPGGGRHRADPKADFASRRQLLSTAGAAATVVGAAIAAEGLSKLTGEIPVVAPAALERKPSGPRVGHTRTDLGLPPHGTLVPATRPPATHAAAPRATRRPQIVQSSSKRAAIILNAKKLLGLPYIYGGNDPAVGLDCSSYTRWVYRQVGLRLPRVADSQMRSPVLKDASRPKVGDLVFFVNGKGYAYHCAIFAGDGAMYAAPHAGAVIRKEKIYSSSVVYKTPF